MEIFTLWRHRTIAGSHRLCGEQLSHHSRGLKHMAKPLFSTPITSYVCSRFTVLAPLQSAIRCPFLVHHGLSTWLSQAVNTAASFYVMQSLLLVLPYSDMCFKSCCEKVLQWNQLISNTGIMNYALFQTFRKSPLKYHVFNTLYIKPPQMYYGIYRTVPLPATAFLRR